jgi:2-oxo-3-hexenedioate decarboxylase
LTGDVDPRLTTALRRQLERRDAVIAGGATSVGWKLGMGEAERIGDHPAVGHLTSATRLDPEATYDSIGALDLRADAEVAVRVGPDAAIAAFAAALEIVDLGAGRDAEEIVATNIFHRAFALGEFRETLPPRLGAQVIVDGAVRDSAHAPDDVDERLRAAAEVLSAAGERLEEGDIVITGSVVQVPVAAGELVVADFGALGRVAVRIR